MLFVHDNTQDDSFVVQDNRNTRKFIWIYDFDAFAHFVRFVLQKPWEKLHTKRIIMKYEV